MEIEYTPTVDDAVAFEMYVCDHSPTLQRAQRATMRWMLFLLLAMLWAIVVPLMVTADDTRAVILGTIVLCSGTIGGVVAYVFFFPDAVRSHMKATIRRVWKERADNVATTRRLVITPESISDSSPLGASSILWPAITSIVSAKNHAFLFTGPANAFIVPKRAFRDESAFEKFVETARAYWEQAKKQNAPL